MSSKEQIKVELTKEQLEKLFDELDLSGIGAGAMRIKKKYKTYKGF